jgi:hypothetical protein
MASCGSGGHIEVFGEGNELLKSERGRESGDLQVVILEDQEWHCSHKTVFIDFLIRLVKELK